jgi:hypothetical protein
MKKYTIILALLLAAALNSCKQGLAEASKKKESRLNFVVLVDLSDRIIYPSQSEKDIAAIESLFSRFERKVNRNLVIKSADKFRVRIIPQRGSRLPAEQWENRLSLDLSILDPGSKAKSLNLFREQLHQNLQELYREAYQGNQPENYFGVDTWSYFFDQVTPDILPGYDNTVLVLTDGYFDFESDAHTLRMKNRYTSTSFLSELGSFDWERKARNEDIGLLPVTVPSNARWLVCGIRAKNDDLLMNKKLCFFWRKWLNESGAEQVSFVLDASAAKIKEQLQQVVP